MTTTDNIIDKRSVDASSTIRLPGGVREATGAMIESEDIMKVALHIYASATIDATSQNLTQPIVIERDTLQLRPHNPHESPERILSTTHIPHTYLYAVYTVTSDGAANVYIIPHHELYPS